jgi:hypothetical protein
MNANAQIGVTVSLTPTTVQEDATYTFGLSMTNLIAANGFILIEFPSDYDFSSQATTEEIKTCTGVAGITSGFLTPGLTCVLNKSTRLLNMTVNFVTSSNEISFTVASIINPTYASQTGSISIIVFNTTASTPEASGSNVRVTPTVGTLAATLTPENGIVGATVRNFILVDIHNF